MSKRYTRVLVSTVFAILAIFAALTVSPAVAQTTGNGPYYATPSWDQTLPSNTRFIVLSNFGGQAVLDRETGLVWERSPSAAVGFTWDNAVFHCNNLSLGNRNGWKLPSIQELTSLMDQSVTPTLPIGHPFTVQVSSIYWASTTKAGADAAWLVFFGNGAINYALKSSTNPFSVWCVRGGAGLDVQ